MAAIKSNNTTPELLIRSMLHKRGFRFRLHVKDLPGKPDIVLPKYHAVIFIHGCFWHGHENCRLYKLPSTRTEYWQKKLLETNLMMLVQKSYYLLMVGEFALFGNVRFELQRKILINL